MIPTPGEDTSRATVTMKGEEEKPKADDVIHPSSDVSVIEVHSTIEIVNPLSSPSPTSSFVISQIIWSDPTHPYEGEATLLLSGESDGFRMQVGYADGKKNGKASIYYPNGVAYMELEFVGDVAEGDYRIRNKNGDVIEEGGLKHGKRHGLVMGDGESDHFYNGCVLTRSVELSGYWEMRENGELVRISELSYDLLLLDGTSYEFERGTYKREVVYEKDKRRNYREWNDNVVIEYDENGEILYEAGYECDLKNGVMENGYGVLTVSNGIVYCGRTSCGRLTWIDPYHDGLIDDRLTRNEELNGYWDVKDKDGRLLSSSEYDSTYSKKEGISYEYENDELIEKSVYDGGVKRRVLLKWKDGKMVEYYENGKRSYEGGWKGDGLNGYIRDGEGTEFGMDGLSLVYRGH